MNYRYISLLPVFFILGCAFPASKQVLEDGGKSISIETALTSIGAGLNGMQTAKGAHNFGLITHKIDVSFNLSIGSSDTNKFEGKANLDAVSGVDGSTTVAKENNQQTASEKKNNSGSTTQTDDNKKETSSSGTSTASTDNKNKVDSTATVKQEVKAGVGLVVETNNKLEASKSNNITISFLSIPAIVSLLDKEKLAFLKSIGYFSDTQKLNALHTQFSISNKLPKEWADKFLNDVMTPSAKPGN